MKDVVAEEIRGLHAWASSVVTGYANARLVVQESLDNRREARAAARAARLEVGRRLNAIWPSLRKGEKGDFLRQCGLEERTARVYRALAAKADSGVPERTRAVPEPKAPKPPRRRVLSAERLRGAIAACTPDERADIGREVPGPLGIALVRSLPPPGKLNRPVGAGLERAQIRT